jgi:glycosyltransferase involved in cell wall biosynthesis
MKVSFLVPAYNEAATIGEVLNRIEDLPLLKQIVVVDDGSSDGTSAILEEWRAQRGNDLIVVRQPNQGKDAAIRTAIRHMDGDIAVIQDADMEYDPADVPALIEPIERGVADVVFGSRLRGGRPQRAYLFWHLVGNRFLSLMTNVLFNTTLSDMETGYKAFRADVLRSLNLTQDDFAIEPEITGEVCRRKLRIYELPIAYYGRTYADGKKITWRDGFKAMRALLVVRVRPLPSSGPQAEESAPSGEPGTRLIPSPSEELLDDLEMGRRVPRGDEPEPSVSVRGSRDRHGVGLGMKARRQEVEPEARTGMSRADLEREDIVP